MLLIPDDAGVGTLYRLDVETGEVTPLAERLDGSSGPANVAVSDDGRFAYLALASDDAPDPASRHEPYADRDLDIYEIDLESGARRPVVSTPAEELAPAMANGALHWVSIETRSEAVVIGRNRSPALVESTTYGKSGGSKER